MGEIQLPPLDDEVRDILGRPCFMVAGLASRLRAIGYEPVRRKAEDEQAVALYWMLSQYVKHGKDWRAKAIEELRAKEAELGMISEA